MQNIIRVSCLALILISLLFLVPPAAAQANPDEGLAVGTTTTTLYPLADAYVDQSEPSTNFGQETRLRVNFNISSFIIFDLSSIPSDAYIVVARLNLNCHAGTHCNIGSCYINAHYCSDNSWTETGITYDNMPDYTESKTYGMEPGWLEGWKTWYITSDVRTVMGLSDNRLTEVLVESGIWGAYDSREGTSSPYLEVEYVTSPYNDITLESVQDDGMTSNLGIITVDGSTTQLPGNVIAAHGSYDIMYGGAYHFLMWETTGGVSVASASSDETSMTVSGTGTLRAVGDIETFEYCHDDGSADSAYFHKAGRMRAVAFTPDYSGNLMTARFFIHSDPYSFRVHVMDTDRNDVVPPFTKMPTSDGWFDVDLSGYGITVTSGVDFYIGMEWITDYKPSLESDDTGDSSGMSWNWDGTEWGTYPDPREYMIRAVVETQMLTSSITFSLSQSSIEYGGAVEVLGSISPANDETASSGVVIQYSIDGDTWNDAAGLFCSSSAYSTLMGTSVPVGNYFFRAIWNGSASYFPAVSQTESLSITRAASQISISLDPDTVDEWGVSTEITGSITPTDSETATVPVTIEFSQDGVTWTKIGEDTCSGSEYYDHWWDTDLDIGTYYVRASWAGSENYLGATSETKTFTVTEYVPTTTSGPGIMLALSCLGGVTVYLLIRRR